MRFCEVCNNMLYLSLHPQDDTRLMYHCKNCAYEEDAREERAPDGGGGSGNNNDSGNDTNNDKRGAATAVLGRNYIDDETKYQQYVTPYLKYDPTLPRLNTIECVNPRCTKPPGKDNEVIYVAYDSTHLRFMYHCCFCETFWNSAAAR